MNIKQLMNIFRKIFLVNQTDEENTVFYNDYKSLLLAALFC